MTEQQRYNRLLLIYAYVEGRVSVAQLEAIFDVVGSQSVHLRQDLLAELDQLLGGRTIAEVRGLVGMPPREG